MRCGAPRTIPPGSSGSPPVPTQSRSLGRAEGDPDMSTNSADARHDPRASIAVALLRWNNVASRGGNEQPLRQSACDLLVGQCGFCAASLGSARAGNENQAQVVQAFPLRCDDVDLGTLRLWSRDEAAFSPTVVELLAAWSEGL